MGKLKFYASTWNWMGHTRTGTTWNISSVSSKCKSQKNLLVVHPYGTLAWVGSHVNKKLEKYPSHPPLMWVFCICFVNNKFGCTDLLKARFWHSTCHVSTWSCHNWHHTFLVGSILTAQLSIKLQRSSWINIYSPWVISYMHTIIHNYISIIWWT